MKIKIDKNFSFDYKKKPLIIAEISGNHAGNKKKFIDLIIQASQNGADLVKIQTYEPEDITLNSLNFKIKKGIWKGKKLWELYKKACTPYEWHHDAFKVAKKHNINLFSTPFSLRALNFLEKRINPTKWKLYTDEEIIDELIKIRGIGRWTAEMFLIFNLCRPDVFPADDLGLIKGICHCYNLEYPIKKEDAIKMAKKWKPYRSVATWYFWRSLDPIPVEY